MPTEETNTADSAVAEVVEYHGSPIASPEAKSWLCGFGCGEMIFDRNYPMGDVTYELRRCLADPEHVNMVPLPQAE